MFSLNFMKYFSIIATDSSCSPQGGAKRTDNNLQGDFKTVLRGNVLLYILILHKHRQKRGLVKEKEGLKAQGNVEKSTLLLIWSL